MTTETLRTLTDDELLTELEHTTFLPWKDAQPILAEAARRLRWEWEDDAKEGRI